MSGRYARLVGAAPVLKRGISVLAGRCFWLATTLGGGPQVALSTFLYTDERGRFLGRSAFVPVAAMNDGVQLVEIGQRMGQQGRPLTASEITRFFPEISQGDCAVSSIQLDIDRPLPCGEIGGLPSRVRRETQAFSMEEFFDLGFPGIGVPRMRLVPLRTLEHETGQEMVFAAFVPVRLLQNEAGYCKVMRDILARGTALPYHCARRFFPDLQSDHYYELRARYTRMIDLEADPPSRRRTAPEPLEASQAEAIGRWK